MKYCPYCGASLVGGAASFCAECGKKIPAQTDLFARSAAKRSPPRQMYPNRNRSLRVRRV